jgi:POT family proton-dependent oligopeptide transporter
VTTRKEAEAIQHPTTAVPGRAEGELWGHPKGLYVLSTTEMWERFSFYSMRGILALYMVNGLAFTDGMSQKIYGAYLGFVYSAPLVGGMLADRLLGQRRAILIGGILMAIAQFSLAAHAYIAGAPLEAPENVVFRETGLFSGLEILFFLGMGFLAIGNGFFKPNISTIVGTLYAQSDARRDGAFTIFYLGINVGALLASLSVQIAQKYGWYWGFFLAGIGMVLGQFVFSWGKRTYAGRGLPPREGLLTSSVAGIPNGALLTVGILVAIPVVGYLLSQPGWVANISTYVGAIVLLYLLWEAFRSPKIERDRMIVIIVLCTFSMIFWAFFELAGSTITLFTDKSIALPSLPVVGTLESGFLNAFINPAFILLLGIPFAKLWVYLDKHKMDPSSPLKFSLGLAQVGLGFFVLWIAAIRAGEDGQASVLFLVLAYLLHTTGELCLSPVGLSMVTKLSPARLVGLFMGLWFFASAFGNVLIGFTVGENIAELGYDGTFKWIGVAGVGSAVVLLALYPLLKRMQHGVK